MLGMGLAMSLDDFKLVFSRTKDVLYGVGLRCIINAWNCILYCQGVKLASFTRCRSDFGCCMSPWNGVQCYDIHC